MEDSQAQEAPGGSGPIRLLVLCGGDPESERAFSGSAKNLINALERAGCVYHKANVLGWSDPFQAGPKWLQWVRRLDRFGLEERYRWSNAFFDANSIRAEHIAAAFPDFNACLLYGTTFNPKLNVPTYCYFDATAAQVYHARAWEFSRFSEQTAQRIIAYQQQVFERCAAIFPRTQWAARSVRDDYGIPEHRIVPAGAGPNYFAEPLPHGPYDNQTILFIGAEFERKGGPLIVEAFRKVREVMPEARLRIVGCSPEVDLPGVEVIGRIPKDAPGGLERLLQVYAEASVFCIMSDFEPFGIVVLEAQNSYVPCVAPARFAFTETIQSHVTGRHVSGHDINELAEILKELLGDPARLAQMGQAGNRFVREQWTWDATARRMQQRIEADLAGEAARGQS